MNTDNAALLDELRSLLAASWAEEPEPSLARIEDTLTAGYAHALALESESWRHERRLGELAAELAHAENAPHVQAELTALAGRMSATSDNLGHLRGLLDAVRRRASELRSSEPRS